MFGVCRTCLRVEEGLSSVWRRIEEDGAYVDDMLAEVCGVRLSYDLHHHHGMCPACCYSLRDAHSFRGMYLEANKRLLLVKHTSCTVPMIMDYSCKTCRFVCDRRRDFDDHLLKHVSAVSTPNGATQNNANIKKFICDNCQYATYNRLCLQIHIDKRRCSKYKDVLKKRLKTIACVKCEYTTNKETKLITHILTHIIGSRYKCKECDYKSDYKYFFDNHIVNHKNYNIGKRSPLACDKCSYVSDSKSSLRLHTTSKHAKQKTYVCDKCNYSTDNKRSFCRHVINHENVTIYNCNKCVFVTNYHTNFTRHMSSHDMLENLIGPIKKSTVTFSCDECSYKTVRRQRLTVHKLKHTNVKTCKTIGYKKRFDEHFSSSKDCKNKKLNKLYTCDKCDYSTNFRRQFDKHIGSLKDCKNKKPDKIYTCNDCEYSTDMKNNLQRHLMIHTNVKKYVCECEYATYRQDNMNKHKLQHCRKLFLKLKSEKNICTICNISFKYNVNFEVHMMSHKNE